MQKFDEVPPIRPDYDQPNYDVSKISPYTLEDPLTFLDGTRVVTADDWQKRRKEILALFAREMYGQEPPKPEALVIEKTEEKLDAFGGYGVRAQYSMWFKPDKSGPCIHWLLVRPRYAKGPVPVILFLNYKGNHEMLPDEEIPVCTAWRRSDVPGGSHYSTAETRGKFCNPSSSTTFPAGVFIARGYAVLTACYCEVSPDPNFNEPDERYRQESFAYTGVFSLWGERDQSRDDNTTALGAWAWALSRGLDLAERIPELDAKRAVVTGCSRLGKSALLAMARDERFAVCVPNQCGGGGVTLAKRDFGENVATEMIRFTHWYCKAYGKYAKNPAKLLTFDQHLLLASIAPRPVLVESFNSSPWMDPEGEFISCQAASPAWEFCGEKGMPQGEYPEPYDTKYMEGTLAFVLRTEEHGLATVDWLWLMDFADRYLKK